jgi:hypothetical protein
VLRQRRTPQSPTLSAANGAADGGLMGGTMGQVGLYMGLYTLHPCKRLVSTLVRYM